MDRLRGMDTKEVLARSNQAPACWLLSACWKAWPWWRRMRCRTVTASPGSRPEHAGAGT